MLYKTMMLELLQQQPKLHERLRASRKLQTATEECAIALKRLHDAWKEQLMGNPSIDPGQLVSAAMEYAQQEMEARLQSVSSRIEQEDLTIEAILAIVHNPTSQD